MTVRELLCTLGPASFEAPVIRRLADLGVSLFRINLSHTRLDEVARRIEQIRAAADVPVCIDTEGAQVRTGDFVEPHFELRANAEVRIHRRRVPGDPWNWNLYPRDIVDVLQVGDLLSIDFHAALLQVVCLDDEGALMRVLNGGRVGRNRAVTVERDLRLPPLTEKDEGAVAIARDLGIRHYALSFANRAEDVGLLRERVGLDATVIAKIECRNGLAHLDAIGHAADALLIDRGDLSREIPLEHIPAAQKTIIAKAKQLGVRVYVATNLLESMVTQPEPTRAEVNDVYNTLADGADGLVLAAETAVGAHPVRCAGMIRRLIRSFESQAGTPPGDFRADAISMLPEPHGGRLVRAAEPPARAEIECLPRIEIDERAALDCVQLAQGTFSPLDGFMGREAFEAVLHGHRLPCGAAWPLPVMLQVRQDMLAGIGPGERVALVAAGTVVALLDVSEIFPVDVKAVLEPWFGTDSLAHPGVQRVTRLGRSFVAGKVTLVERPPSPYRHLELSPSQTRYIFARKGWSRVVGFHTRNAAHRVHEYMQLEALVRTGADGLYINPVLGPKKPGDFQARPIVRSYQAMIDFEIYPRDRVVLGVFASYPRYAGPREAVFTALCRKNMGCSHFIVGRDHTGVGDFYPAHANREMFERLDDLGIEPVFFDEIGYDAQGDRFAPVAEGGSFHRISGTAMREALRDGRRIDGWAVRDVVQDVLAEELSAGEPIFFEAPAVQKGVA